MIKLKINLSLLLMSFILVVFVHGINCHKRNVLLIIVDDLRPALGCYKDEKAYTPNLDQMSEKSVLFRNAFAQQALCAPSRNSFLTSRRPDSLHLYDFYSYWRDVAGNFTTLPQYFKENGYFTMSIGKVFHPGASSNKSDDQPYSWSETPYHPSSERFKDSRVCSNNDGSLGRNLVCPVDLRFQPEKTLPDIQSLARAKHFLRSAMPKPFFLAVGFHKPHIPLKFPRKYLAYHDLDNMSLPVNRWRPYGLPSVAWNPWTDLREREDITALNISFPFQPIPDSYSRVIRQHYYAAVTYTDSLIGELLSQLDHVGMANDTIVLIIGDNGWSLGEHGEWAKYSNMGVSLQVPFMLHIPGTTNKGFISHHLVELVDILPTLVDLAQLPTIPICPTYSSNVSLCTQGLSLEPLVHHIVTERTVTKYQWKQAVFSQYPRPGSYPTLHPNSDKPRLTQIKIMGYSVRTHRHRYTEWVQFDNKHFKPIWRNIIAIELYDLKLDPGENLNMIDREELKEVVDRLRYLLHSGWRYTLKKYLLNSISNTGYQFKDRTWYI